MKLFQGRNNRGAIRLYEAGARKTDLSGLTRVVLEAGGETVDSQTVPLRFDWTHFSDDAGDLLVVDIASLVPLGAYNFAVTYYDATHTDGVKMPEPFVVRVEP